MDGQVHVSADLADDVFPIKRKLFDRHCEAALVAGR